MKMNKELYSIEEEWNNNIVIPAVERFISSTLSHPYFMGVTEEYQNSSKRVMIVGQEPDNFDEYNIPFNIRNEQQWSIAYQEKQLYGRGGEKRNTSPFWLIFKDIIELGGVPCWNNIDNLHRIVNGKTVPLIEEIEKYLQKPYGDDRKSLLLKQIEISQPNVIWFVTGPRYYKTMAAGLQVDEDELKKYSPSKKMMVVKLPFTLDNNAPIFWSYHPKYLNLNKVRRSVSEYVMRQGE